MKLVFISSTFKDMQFERDRLHTHVMPLLDAKLQSEGESVYFGDLRWGVNTTDLDSLQSSKKVLDVCLDEIDGCKPFMIVFVGERYGWIPEGDLLRETASLKGLNVKSDISVTQLEIEYGALLHPEYKGRVFFYFRELDKTGMTPEQRKDYEAESPLHAQKIAELKARIESLFPNQIRTYKARWDPATSSVVGLENLMQMVYDDLDASFRIPVREPLYKEDDWQAIALNHAHGLFMETTANYTPFIEYKVFLGAPMEEDELSRIRLNYGRSGSGKTAWLAMEYKIGLSDDDLRVPFSYGLDAFTTQPVSLLLILLYLLERELKIPHVEYDPKTADIEKAVQRVKFLAGRVKKNIYLFVDNADPNILSIIESLYGEYDADNYLSPEKKRNGNIYVYCTYRSDQGPLFLPPCSELSSVITSDEVQEGAVIDFVQAIAKEKHKELSIMVIKEIEKKICCYDPYYLRLITERLLMLDSQDFEAIRRFGDGMDAINDYMIGLIHNQSDFLDGLVKELAKEAAERIDADFVHHYLALLCYTADYIPQAQVEYAFSKLGYDYSPLHYALVTKYLRYLFSYRPYDNAYAVLNDEARNALVDLLKEVAGKKYADEINSFIFEEPYDSFFRPYALRAASYSLDGGLLAKVAMNELLLAHRSKDDRAMEKTKRRLGEVFLWMFEKWPGELPAVFLRSLVEDFSDFDHTYLLDYVPTTHLTEKETERVLAAMDMWSYSLLPYNPEESPMALSSFMAFNAKYIALKLHLDPRSAVDNSLYSPYLEFPMLEEARERITLSMMRAIAENIDAEFDEEEGEKDILSYCFNEEDYLGTPKERFMLTVFKAEALFVASRYLFQGQVGFGRLLHYIEEAMDLLCAIDIKDPVIADNITYDDLAMLTEATRFYFENVRSTVQEKQKILTALLGLIRHGNRVISPRCNALLADLYECCLGFIDEPEDKRVLYSALVAKREWLCTITHSIEEYFPKVRADGELLFQFLHLGIPIHFEADEDAAESAVYDFDLDVHKILEEKEVGETLYRLFLPLLQYVSVVAKGTDNPSFLASLLNPLAEVDIAQTPFPVFTDLCISALFYAYGQTDAETIESIEDAYQQIMVDEDYGYVRHRYRDTLSLIMSILPKDA